MSTTNPWAPDRAAQPIQQAPWVPARTVLTARSGAELIPGRPGLIEADAQHLREVAARVSDASGHVDSAVVDQWAGLSADAYETARTGLRRGLDGATDALNGAASALEQLADVLRWAQDKASGATELAQRPVTDKAHQDVNVANANADLRSAALVLADAEDQAVGSLRRLSEFLPDTPSPLAQGLDALGERWGSMSPWEQILIGAVIAAAVASSGGSLGVAMGVSGAATWGLSHASGVGTFIDQPGSATSAYFKAESPGSVALDLGEGVLTFGPGAFGGAVFGRGFGVLGREVAASGLEATLSARQALYAAAPDAGVIDFAAFARRDTIVLANGSTLLPVDGAHEATVIARANAFPDAALRARGQARAFQIDVFGSAEKALPLSNGRTFAADGITTPYGGSVGDAKLVLSERSFYVPESLTSASLADVAMANMDKSLLRMADASQSLGGSGAIEIVTNNAASAAAWEARMRALGIDGYARLHPQGG